MRKYIFLLALALCISGNAGIAFAQQGSFSTLRIGTTNYTGKLDNIWEALLSHLQIKLGVKCSLVKANDLAQIQDQPRYVRNRDGNGFRNGYEKFEES